MNQDYKEIRRIRDVALSSVFERELVGTLRSNDADGSENVKKKQ